MKKSLSILVLIGVVSSNLFAIYVDCGCAIPGPTPNPCYDIEYTYRGVDDCCHPAMEYGGWAHLDCVTNEVLDHGSIHAIDAAFICAEYGSGC